MKYWPFPEADMSVWEIYAKRQMFLELNGFENFKVPLDPDRKLCIFCGFSPICNSQSILLCILQSILQTIANGQSQ